MKALLIVGILALLMVAPGVAADDDPVCGGQGVKTCAVETVHALLGPCNPLYTYVKECDPTS